MIELNESAPKLPPMQLIINAEHESELLDYIKAKDYYGALFEIKSKLRNMVKHGFSEDIKDTADMLIYIRNEFNSIVEEYNIDLDK